MHGRCRRAVLYQQSDIDLDQLHGFAIPRCNRCQSGSKVCQVDECTWMESMQDMIHAAVPSPPMTKSLRLGRPPNNFRAASGPSLGSSTTCSNQWSTASAAAAVILLGNGRHGNFSTLKRHLGKFTSTHIELHKGSRLCVITVEVAG